MDFEKKIIHVRHQLRNDTGEYKATSLKTENGLRDLRLTDELAEQFQVLIGRKPKVSAETRVKEYDDTNKFTGKYVEGFITLNKEKSPIWHIILKVFLNGHGINMTDFTNMRCHR